MTTRELETEIYFTLAKMGTYLCFEVMIPEGFSSAHRYGNNERVDLLTWDTRGDWKFYELKISVSDFHSKAKKTFLGNLNYYVMPFDVYERVKNEIPHNIGCYVSDGKRCRCVKKATRQNLQGCEESLKKAFIQSLSRQHHKLMRIRQIGELRTLQEFQEYAKQHGYKSGWAFMKWKARCGK